MKTQVMLPDPQSITLAADLFKNGQLVGFPTETVYGLGANAFNSDAVRSIFAAKGRPADNPLIVHIWNRSQLGDLCEIPPLNVKLMDAFWPGPLTLLFPRKQTVPDVVTAGLSTVAIRMPSHPVAYEMLKACNLPIAAPSANLSGKPSPTRASHVFKDMNGIIPLILDGGNCDVGLESTVVDVCHGQPTILRPGGVTQEMLESVLGCQVAIAKSTLEPLAEGEKPLSPGMAYKHYAPTGSIVLITGEEQNVLSEMRRLVQADTEYGFKSCVMCFTEHVEALRDCHPHDFGSCHSDKEVAKRLFDILRQLDDEAMERIYSEVVFPEGMGLAVMNRLGRAAAFRTIKV